MVTSLDELKRNVFPGESGGDYNALFRFANQPGGQFSNVRLTDMTVNEALQFSDPNGPYAASVRGQVGRTATPMGAYQVVGTTLRDAAAGLGLTGNERMTPELQDRIGMWIYQNQGPGAWEGWGGRGNITMSSSGGPNMGLLDFQQEPQTFGERLKDYWQSGDLMANLAIGLNSLRMRPDQNLAEALTQQQQRRGEARVANRTAQWLAANGREDLAQALMSGAIDPKSAAAIALTPPEAVNGVEVGGKLVDPRTGQVIYDPTGGAAPTLTSDQLSSLNTLRDDATQTMAETRAMGDAWTNIETFYQNPGAVSDRALVIAFAKILDPTSVVRESESAAIANSGSLDEGMRSMLLNALQGGGNLPPDIRNEIVALARDMYANKMPAVQERLNMLRTTAERAGLPPELVFPGTLTPPQPLAPAGSQTPPPPPGGAVPAPTTFVPAR